MMALTSLRAPTGARGTAGLARALRAHATIAIAALLGVSAVPALGCAQKPDATRAPDVVFVPTPPAVVRQMLAVARVGKNDTLFDLGSGDGRIVITAAKRLGARGIGIDIDPQRIRESRHNADTAGVTHLVEFRQADLFETDLRSATVVTLYLLPALNVKLRPKLFAELRPGTRVVSHDFDMADWVPDSTYTVDGRPVHYWLMPANVAGRWTVTAPTASGERRYELRLEQQYQRVTGTATAGGRTVPLSDVRIRGDRVTFSLAGAGGPGRLMFAGRVDGTSMSGSFRRGDRGAATTWSATRRTAR